MTRRWRSLAASSPDEAIAGATATARCAPEPPSAMTAVTSSAASSSWRKRVEAVLAIGDFMGC